MIHKIEEDVGSIEGDDGQRNDHGGYSRRILHVVEAIGSSNGDHFRGQ